MTRGLTNTLVKLVLQNTLKNPPLLFQMSLLPTRAMMTFQRRMMTLLIPGFFMARLGGNWLRYKLRIHCFGPDYATLSPSLENTFCKGGQRMTEAFLLKIGFLQPKGEQSCAITMPSLGCGGLAI